MKLEEGMCVRTKNGCICQILRTTYSKYLSRNKELCYEVDRPINVNMELYDEDIFKASFNIIDLIEVGDVITFKEDEDVYKIIGVPNEKYACKFFHLAKEFDGGTEDIIVGYGYMKESINSIVTKEQFESVQYKVSE